MVLSQRLSGKGKDIDNFNLYRKLRQVNPSPYMYYFNMGDYGIVGSSPEMLVELKDEVIRTCPIAGTRRIGETKEENDALAADLLADEKERAEHMMLVDLGRNDMGKVSEIDSVNVDMLMEVHKYSHVMHLVSLVSGKRREELSMFDVLMSFLPAGTCREHLKSVPWRSSTNSRTSDEASTAALSDISGSTVTWTCASPSEPWSSRMTSSTSRREPVS